MTAANLERAIARAHGAFIDARADNKIFQHKQLSALYHLLQSNSQALLSALSPSSIYSLELLYCLDAISHAIETLPTNLAKTIKREINLEHVLPSGKCEGRLSTSTGVVAIVSDGSHPFASWVVPLVASIQSGNTTVILHRAVNKSLHEMLYQPFRLALDQESFHLVLSSEAIDEELSDDPRLAGIVGLGDSIPSKPDSTALHNGPIPVIIDQSILPGGKPLHPISGEGLPTPQAVKVVAANIASAFQTADRTNNRPVSAGYPSYLVVHENVAALIKRELDLLLPSSVTIEVHSRENKDIIKSLMSNVPGYLDYVPLFTVSSLDSAIDWIQNDCATPSTAYIFSSRSFGVYAINSLKSVRHCFVNDISQKIIACGPYNSAKDFHLTTQRHVVIYDSPVAPTTQVLSPKKPRDLKQVPGKRIDFFGGSFLFAAGIFLSTVLGSTGYGLYKGAVWLWKNYAK